MNGSTARTRLRGIVRAAGISFCVAGIVMVVSGCQSLGDIASGATGLGVLTGNISENQAQSINQSAQAVQKSFEDITPEQEYYIGRAVAATILDEYKEYDDPAAIAYINKLGQALAMASDLPVTWSGYHFMILDTDEVNALSAPSGFVFVTRGILRTAHTESQLAAILAHEIGHVEHHHGLQAIKKSRITSALTSAAITGASVAGSPALQKLTATFGDSIKDITSTLINNGYSREFEKQADQSAVEILERVGYDPHALIQDLKNMESVMKPGQGGFETTHPSPEERIKVVEQAIGNAPTQPGDPVRQSRFDAAMKGI